jgi:DNA-binding CsgD family transcriptional regulator
MRPKPALNRVLKLPQPQPSVDLPESGVVLVDMALNPIAADDGAARIFGGPDDRPGASQSSLFVPDEVLQAIRGRDPSALSATAAYMSVGRQRYRYRAYLVESEIPSLPRTMIAVHIEADSNGIDPIGEMATKFHLTEREAEALRGIALGLSTKELADRMKISPNTVKAFVRLIMIKLGVTTRTAIIVKLLENHEPR